jgi:glycosyltransferase involved in cell wall biosynthesis
MKIIQVLPTLEEEASGPSYSVPRLAEALAERDHDVSLMTAGGQAVTPGGRLDFQRYPRDFGDVPILRVLELSHGLYGALRRDAAQAQIIHANGLWTAPTLYPAWAARRSAAILVCSPRGTLSPVALVRSAYRKRIFWLLAQRGAVADAALLHATSEQEYRDIRAFGLRQPVVVIPNGVDVPETLARRRRGGRRRLLYLGRLHPIKGLETLLQAWAQVAPEFDDWELRLVGPGEEAYVARLTRLAADLRLPRVAFAGPSYGAEKTREYQSAELYVLPSLSENFGMSVAEALAHGLPVITTHGAPWSGVEARDCGWWVPGATEAIAWALRQALAKNPPALAQMGARGRDWMLANYSWKSVARSMEQAYEWIRHGGELPDTMYVS